MPASSENREIREGYSVLNLGKLWRWRILIFLCLFIIAELSCYHTQLAALTSPLVSQVSFHYFTWKLVQTGTGGAHHWTPWEMKTKSMFESKTGQTGLHGCKLHKSINWSRQQPEISLHWLRSNTFFNTFTLFLLLVVYFSRRTFPTTTPPLPRLAIIIFLDTTQL